MSYVGPLAKDGLYSNSVLKQLQIKKISWLCNVRNFISRVRFGTVLREKGASRGCMIIKSIDSGPRKRTLTFLSDRAISHKMSDSVPGKQSFEYEVEKKTEKSRNCEPCEEGGDVFTAFGFCVDCQNYLCESCFKCHCIPKPMKKHRLLNTVEMPRKKVSEDLSEICKKHEGETIRYYCKNHDVVGCNSCMLLEHKPCQEICGLNEMAQDVETSQSVHRFMQQSGQN
ncbi:tripartite motif-containing protein 66-like [Mercenaria mercenaria]|uniref:tripartite motif-containing protein 66-like n=1 Tax=Mercenaria mercenaria TaxID=6596 RepID=UPI001E1D5F79|nr:tripartite motif-containing protein 66-like [Mercenaria mercenaria]